MNKPLHYCFLVIAHPECDSVRNSICQIAKALLQQGHVIQKIFFYFDGNAYANCCPRELLELRDEFGVTLEFCRTALMRNNIEEILDAITIASLGAFASAVYDADRVIVFKGGES